MVCEVCKNNCRLLQSLSLTLQNFVAESVWVCRVKGTDLSGEWRDAGVNWTGLVLVVSPAEFEISTF
jgi:hypothetical protein